MPAIEPATHAQPAVSNERRDEIEKAEADERAAEKARLAKSNFVLYLGPGGVSSAESRPSGFGGGALASHHASISVSEWAAVKIPAQHGHEWHVGNDWRIPADQFTPAQLDHLLTAGRDAKQVRFAFVDADGKPAQR